MPLFFCINSWLPFQSYTKYNCTFCASKLFKPLSLGAECYCNEVWLSGSITLLSVALLKVALHRPLAFNKQIDYYKIVESTCMYGSSNAVFFGQRQSYVFSRMCAYSLGKTMSLPNYLSEWNTAVCTRSLSKNRLQYTNCSRRKKLIKRLGFLLVQAWPKIGTKQMRTDEWRIQTQARNLINTSPWQAKVAALFSSYDPLPYLP